MKINATHLLLQELGIVLLMALVTWTHPDVPYFTEEPQSAVVTIDSSLTLHCSVHPHTAVVRWKFNKEFINADNSFGIIFNGTNLHIDKFKEGKPPRRGNEGIYQCTATTGLGTVYSKAAIVQKAVLKKFEDRDDLHLNVTVGHDLILPCQLPESVPEAQIMFKVNKTKIINTTSDHYRILPSGSLLMTNVTQEDQGQYQCVAYNVVRDKTRISNHVIHVHVLTTVVPKQETAIITSYSKIKGKVGHDVLLECFAVGNPQPVISWEKYGGVLSLHKHTLIQGNLFLKNVKVDDEGTYICKAHNGIGSIKLKAMMFEVVVPPVVSSVQDVFNATIGGDVQLECSYEGRPRPRMWWLHNGVEVPFQSGPKFTLKNIRALDQGLYQCFAENEAGLDYATINVHIDMSDLPQNTEKASNNLPIPSINGATDSSEKGTSNNSIKDIGSPSKKNSSASTGRSRHNHKSKKKKRKKKKGKQIKDKLPTKAETTTIKLVPPSAPEVKQLSDSSVMLNWTVPDNDGLKITFFRVQYKELAPEKSNWKTENDEIPGHLHMYEVRRLTPGGTYKFRIAAVYSNNDNKHGPNSNKYVIKVEKANEPMPPQTAPIIVEVVELEHENNYALNVMWQYKTSETSPVEGFFIYSKPYHSSEEYKRLMLLGPNLRAHMLKNLTPDTEYSIKMQSFNTAGYSEFSNTVVRRTLGASGKQNFIPPIRQPELPKAGPNPNEIPGLVPTSTSRSNPPETNEQPAKTGTQTSSEMLYMVLGIVLGVMMFLLIIFMFMCWWKQRQQRRMMDAMNDAVRNKFQDQSQHIYMDSLRKKHVNGGIGMNGFAPNGHKPHNYHKMNINVNPLSDMETANMQGLSNTCQHSSFLPNGTIPGHHSKASDNNFNDINRSKSLENSLQHSNYSLNNPAMQNGETLHQGHSPVCSPSSLADKVPHEHCIFLDMPPRLNSSIRSCDQLCGSHDHVHRSCDSALSCDFTGGINSYPNSKQRKRRHRMQSTEQEKKDQATNTDLSSNEGTMEISAVCKAAQSAEPVDPDLCLTSLPDGETDCQNFPQGSNGV
ncbi:hypothetical protein ACJMK2_024964 [Sinanodonta woodiana]|uniref:Interference hedgehog n=1 Tax=Sinanodonta woodiana TaxID=1069815 RepID=A0ABD3XIX5_SINWO